MPGANVFKHLYHKDQGNLTFFFKRQMDVSFPFESVFWVPYEKEVLGYDVAHRHEWQFRILKEASKFVVIKEEATEDAE